MVGRIPVMDVAPVVEHGRYPAKASVGESFDVSALVFRDGHDQLGADVVLTDPGGNRRDPVRMAPLPQETARRAATVTPDEVGAWSFTIESWSDTLGTWVHDAGVKIRAEVDVELMFLEGTLLLERWGREVQAPKDERRLVLDAISALRDTDRPVEVRLAAAEDPALVAALTAYPLRDLLTAEGPYPLFVDRARALYGSWYEFFPRSEGAYVDKSGQVVAGTFTTAAK